MVTLDPIPERFAGPQDALAYLVAPPLTLERLRNMRTNYDSWDNGRKDTWHEALFSGDFRDQVTAFVAGRPRNDAVATALFSERQTRAIYVNAIATGDDVTLRPEFHGGEVSSITLEEVYPGGGPTNAVRAMLGYGLSVTPLITCGSGVKGKLFAEMLAQEGVVFPKENFFVLQGRDSACHLFVIHAPLLEQRIIQPSPAFDPDEFHRYPQELRRISPSPGIMLISSRAPSNASTDFHPSIARQSVDDGHLVLLDPKPDQVAHRDPTLALLNAPIDLIKPDLGEFFEIYRHSVRPFSAGEKIRMDEGDAGLVHQHSRAILERHSTVKGLLVSLGKHGALLTRTGSDKAWYVAAPKVEERSSVGAGDAGLAAFCGCLATADSHIDLRNPPEELLARSLKMFVLGGSAAVTKPGTGLGTAADIRALPEVKVERLS